MVEEQRNRQLWLETALIFAAWTVFGLFMANQFYMQLDVRGEPVSWDTVLRHGLFEAYLWAFVTLAIFWLPGASRSNAGACSGAHRFISSALSSSRSQGSSPWSR